MRLAAIEPLDLKVFDFDHDLTFMVLFMNAEQQVYARYGGRCEQGPDARQSLEGLRSTMKSVLVECKSDSPRFAPKQPGKPFLIREVAPPRGLGRCIHCHQAKEVVYNDLDRKGKWNTELAFRYPLPENVGLKLDVDRSHIVTKVAADSPAETAGIEAGDRLLNVNQVPIHSEADVRFALDRAPKRGSIDVTWQRDGRQRSAKLTLADRWKRTDISWRPSLQNFVATCRIYGKDLKEGERDELGLTKTQLAFRQKASVPAVAKKAGIREGDVILGFDDNELDMSAYDFLLHVRSNYLKGETVKVNVIRNGRKLRLTMKLD
ncbi:MAG: PDZ domain-containing protein [Planctomycetaceae bacterium]|nr:PDZ domain-containing protein [Planctomycetaceae bacterium]